MYIRMSITYVCMYIYYICTKKVLLIVYKRESLRIFFAFVNLKLPY